MPLTIEQVNGRILQWRDGISHNMEQIRRSQDELLLQVGAEHMPYALTAMAAMMAKGGIIVSTTNNTSIGNAGVAVTGGEVHGNVSGTAQHNTTQTQNQALDGLAKLKQSLLNSTELNADQKEEAASALEDLEGEAKKPEESRSAGRVRNAFKALMTTISIAKGAEFLYKDVLPHLEAFFHLAK